MKPTNATGRPVPALPPFARQGGRFLTNPPEEEGVRWAEIGGTRNAEGVALHLVSSRGVIWSRYWARPLRTWRSAAAPSASYEGPGLEVYFNCGGRRCRRRVHVLVAEAFVPMPRRIRRLRPTQRVVLFLDGDDENADAGNLRWGSLEEVRRRDALAYQAATIRHHRRRQAGLTP